jgi:hypothetical protein
MDQHF